MDIMKLGAIGELVGGVAVIATLIYLAVQIRQSASVSRAAAERDLLDGVQKLNERVVQNPAIFRRGLNSFNGMSKDEQLVFASLFNPFINYLEQALRMHARGLLTQDNVDLYGLICLSVVQEPGGWQVWQRAKPTYFPMSRSYLQLRLETGADLPPPISEILPWWGTDEGEA